MDFRTPHRSATPAVSDSPPPGVLRAIEAAGAAYDRLEASGHTLHFHLAPDSGELTVLVLDLDGAPVGTLPVRAVLDLAAGTPLQ